MSRSGGDECRGRGEVRRSGSITEVHVSSVLANLAETRAFYSADIRSTSRSSTESVMLTRATHMRGDHGEPRVGVKRNLFSGK